MSSNPSQRELQVLIVEDSPLIARCEAEALRAAGFAFLSRRVDNAADMAAALDADSWDVVLSDYHMPGFTGLDALRLLRARDTTTPFILLTLDPFPGLAGAIEDEGGQACLDKADLFQLPDLLAQLLQ